MGILLKILKSFFGFFNVVIITNTELEARKDALLVKLDKSYQVAAKEEGNNIYIAQRPMFVRGEISVINDLLGRNKFNYDAETLYYF